MIKIIDNYRNLPVGKWLEILELSKDENVDELEQQVKTIAILTGLTEDEVLDLPIVEYRELASKTKFLEKEYEGKLQIAKSYGLNGMELIPIKFRPYPHCLFQRERSRMMGMTWMQSKRQSERIFLLLMSCLCMLFF